jgi:hypothetical protein
MQQRALTTIALLCVLQLAVGDVPPGAQYVGSFVGTSSQRFGLVRDPELPRTRACCAARAGAATRARLPRHTCRRTPTCQAR